MQGVEEATQTFLDIWQKYGNDVEGLSVCVSGGGCLHLSRQRNGTILVEHSRLPSTAISDQDLPETVVRVVEGVSFPAALDVYLYATRDPRDVPANMHVEWLPVPEHVTRQTSQMWEPYLDYARRVGKLDPGNNLPQHLQSYNSGCDRAALVNKNGTVIGHAVVDEPEPGEDMTLVRLFVDPNRRKRGGGGVLVRAVEKRAREVGAPGIRLDSSAEGERFYRGEGYRNRGGWQFYKSARNFR